MAISNRLAAARRNALSACLCAALAGTAGSGACANAQPHPLNSTLAPSLAIRAPFDPFASVALPAAAKHAHATPGNVVSVSTCADDGGPETLRNAIAAASDGDTIDMSGLACSTITLEHGQLISPVADLTLKGPGADALTIDGNNGGLVISGGNLDIQGITIAHGVNLSGLGGCVLTYGDLSLSNVDISACIAADGTASAVGGGVAVLGNLTMHRSTISSSKANGHDNAAGGGAAVGGTATLYDSAISGNMAETSQGPAYGGGLFGNGAITLHASTIDGNTAYSPNAVGYGGGIHSSLADISVLDGSAVTNNSAGSFDKWSYGGGINIGVIGNPVSATVTVSHSTISGNAASSHCSSNCFVTGGGVQAADSIVVEYSTIDANKAVCVEASSTCKAAGGGLSSAGLQAASSITLRNATISTNDAIGATIAPAIGIAGGIVANLNAKIVAHNATIAFNHASTSGAGISARAPSELIGTIVANNDTDTGPSDIGLGLFANSLTIDGSNNLVVVADSNVTLPNNTESTDPHLQPLTTDDGGTMPIHPLAPDSIAIDAGANPDSLGCDQRGFPYRRVHGASADIGAYEFQGEKHLFADNFDGPAACPPSP